MTNEVRRAGPPRGAPPACTFLDVVAPPRPPEMSGGGWLQGLVATGGSLGMVGFALVGGSRMFLVLALALSGLSLAASVGGRWGSTRRSRRRAAGERARWRDHLDLLARQAREAAAAQRSSLAAVAPEGRALAAAAARAGPLEPATGWTVSLGAGRVQALVQLRAPVRDPIAEADEGLWQELAEAVAGVAWVPAAPVLHDWPAGTALAVVGSREESTAVARSLLCQIAARLPPGELGVVLCSDRPSVWEWLKWLPQGVRVADPDAGLPRESPAGVLRVVDGDRPDPVRPGAAERLLLLCEHRRAVPAGAHVVEVGVGAEGLAGGPALERETRLSAVDAEEVARSLAPRWRRATGSRADSGLLSLLGPAGRRPAAPAGALTAPLGRDDRGRPVHLNLAEAAAGGHGPHGLVVGATGTGKSELLRSLLLGLAAAHPARQLAFLLADWKGGAAFDGLAVLPHVAGLVTNLVDEPGQVARVCAALRAELTRRQELLRVAGVDSLAALSAAGIAGPPILLVVIDEFAELLGAEPDVLEVLVAVGRLGRSLGIQLLLSTQRLEEGRLRGLEGQLRYRICLRVASAVESLTVLGVPDAAALPPQPGWAILAVDGTMHRFRAAHTGAVIAGAPPLLRPLTLAQPLVCPGSLDSGAEGAPATGQTERDLLVTRMRGQGPRAEVVWLPPLPAELAALPVERDAAHLPLGLTDDVAHARQQIWQHAVTGEGAAHLALAGGPRTGATGLLRTLISAAVTAHPPAGLQLVVLDFGGGLFPDEEPDHLRCLAGPGDGEVAAAAVAELRDRIRAPRRDDGAQFRPAGVLVVVDGLAAARNELPELDADLAVLAAEGLRHGIVVALSVQRWSDLRPVLRDVIDTRCELRLADPADSWLPRTRALGRAAPPGRLVTGDGLQVQVAHPLPPGGWRRDGRVDRLRPLPSAVAAAADELAVRSGDLAPVRWSGESLLILGDRGSGRTTALRRIVAVTGGNPLARRCLLVDPRGRLRDLAARGVAWTAGGDDTRAALDELVATLTERRASLGRGSGAGGPQHVVVVDDADLVAGAPYVSPLLALSEHVPLATELGLALVVAHPVTGWARSSFDPFLTAVREACGLGLLLRGDPHEGPVLHGHRADGAALPGRGRWFDGRDVCTVQLVLPPDVTLRREPGVAA